MTSPRGGYYASSSFPDTPIYDSLVAERGTPQIAPIRVPAAYASPAPYSSYESSSNLPALPALPALPSAPSSYVPQQGSYGYPQTGYQQPPLQNAPAPYIPQQATAPRGYNDYNGYNSGYPGQAPQQGGNNGYDGGRQQTPRPVPPRQAPGGYTEDPYQRRNLGQGYYQG